MKRSEYVALVNEVMDAETAYIRKTMASIQESENKDMLAELWPLQYWKSQRVPLELLVPSSKRLA